MSTPNSSVASRRSAGTGRRSSRSTPGGVRTGQRGTGGTGEPLPVPGFLRSGAAFQGASTSTRRFTSRGNRGRNLRQFASDGNLAAPAIPGHQLGQVPPAGNQAIQLRQHIDPAVAASAVNPSGSVAPPVDPAALAAALGAETAVPVLQGLPVTRAGISVGGSSHRTGSRGSGSRGSRGSGSHGPGGSSRGTQHRGPSTGGSAMGSGAGSLQGSGTRTARGSGSTAHIGSLVGSHAGTRRESVDPPASIQGSARSVHVGSTGGGAIVGNQAPHHVGQVQEPVSFGSFHGTDQNHHSRRDVPSQIQVHSSEGAPSIRSGRHRHPMVESVRSRSLAGSLHSGVPPGTRLFRDLAVQPNGGSHQPGPNPDHASGASALSTHSVESRVFALEEQLDQLQELLQ